MAGRLSGVIQSVWGRLRSSGWAREWALGWKSAPLRWAGLVLLCAACANLLTLWMLRRPVGASGIALRAALGAVGLAAMGCRGDWESVRKGSRVLRFLFPRRER